MNRKGLERVFQKFFQSCWGAVIVMIVAAVLIVPQLSYCLVFQVSEAREGFVVREILRTGEFILPLRHGDTIPSKPILFHWLGSICGALLGEYREFALRLPSALAAVGIVGVIYSLARRNSGVTSALLASMILLSTYVFTHLAIDGRVDMLFCFFVVAAIAIWVDAAARLIEQRKNLQQMPEAIYCLCGFFCGLGVLAKGPLGIVLPGLVITAISWALFDGLRGVRAILRPGWLLALAVGLPWYILATISGKDSFLARQIIFENLTRFFGGSGIPSKPFYYYLIHIWSQSAPWSVAAFVCAYLMLRASRVPDWKQSFPTTTREGFLFRASLVWVLTIVLFLSLSVGKRRAYLLPAIPAFSLAISLALRQVFSHFLATPEELRRWISRVRSVGFVLFIGVPVLALIVYLLTLGNALPFIENCAECKASMYQLPNVIERAPIRILFSYLFFSLGAVLLWRHAFRTNSMTFAVGAFFLFLQLIYVVLVPSFLGVKGLTHTYERFSREISSVLPPDAKLSLVMRPGDESFDALFFYYPGRLSIQNRRTRALSAGYYLARRRWIDSRGEKFKGSIRIILTGGRLIDTPDEQLVLFEKTA